MTNSTLCAIINSMEAKERYRIKGKIYYKLVEEQLRDCDKDLVDAIWQVQNTKGDMFRLLISRGGRNYTLYEINGSYPVLKTNSISKVG